MKKVLLLIAFVVAFIGAKAQSYQVTYLVDSLSYKRLAADYVSLNNQVRNFRNDELVSLGTGAVSVGFATAGLLMAQKEPEAAKAMYFCAGITGITSLVWHIVGLAQLKRDRLEVAPNGVIIKLTPKK